MESSGERGLVKKQGAMSKGQGGKDKKQKAKGNAMKLSVAVISLKS